MYTVIGSIASRTFRVLWMLEELGLKYEHRSEYPHSESVRSLSKHGKIPVLTDGDQVLTDSSAIVTYLADHHNSMTAPAGTHARALQDAMTFRILDEVDAVLWTAARHSFILPEDQRVPEIKTSLKTEFSRNVERIMADKLGNYLMGNELTVPDIVLGHCGGWAQSAKFPVENREFVAYLELCRSRPAFQSVNARR